MLCYQDIDGLKSLSCDADMTTFLNDTANVVLIERLITQAETILLEYLGVDRSCLPCDECYVFDNCGDDIKNAVFDIWEGLYKSRACGGNKCGESSRRIKSESLSAGRESIEYFDDNASDNIDSFIPSLTKALLRPYKRANANVLYSAY